MEITTYYTDNLEDAANAAVEMVVNEHCERCTVQRGNQDCSTNAHTFYAATQ